MLTPAKFQIAVGALVALVLARPARAWIYPEHRDIALAGLARLAAPDREALQKLWAEARKTAPDRWCESIDFADQGPAPKCVDFSAWAALAGDHSCSPKHLTTEVIPGPWVLDVAAVAAETKHTIATSTNRIETLNAIARSNLALQRADPEFATRAGANNAHFMLARTDGQTVTDYLKASTLSGAPLNAVGLYVQYHLAALAAAEQLRGLPENDQTRPEKARQVLALAGYALHWMEDSYAAGHVVGTWGDAAWRKGTHDYYSEFGLDTVDWGGRSIVMFGDSKMKPADLERASSAVAQSMHEVAAALSPGDALTASTKSFGPGPDVIFAFDSCKEEKQPADNGYAGVTGGFWKLFDTYPVAARGAGDVHLPRFRDELGPFAGVFLGINAGPAWGGVSPNVRGSTSITAGARFGLGLEGVTGSVGTGLMFAEAGIELTTAQVDRCDKDDAACAGLGATTLFPRMPARTGLRLGLRLPFWLIPGDVLILAPILFLVSPQALSTVGVQAASGGLIPYEQSVRTGAGIFQFVAGREVQGTLYGYLGERNIPLVIVPVDNPNRTYGVLELRSLNLQFPVIEYTPFRTFATQISFSANIQLGFMVEIPLSQKLATTGVLVEDVGTTWGVFLRFSADSRYFLGSRDHQ